MADDRDIPHDRLDDATLVRYLSGTCGAAELARVERWLAANPAHAAELAQLRAAWNPPPAPEADPHDEMWQRIAARMDAPLPRPAMVRGRRTWRAFSAHPAHGRRAGLIAAAIVLGVAGVLGLQLLQRFRPAGPVATTTAAPAMRELATRRGERATGHLPDGSRVILGPDSRLLIPTTFAATSSVAGTRDVHLQGEAFFEVTHDSTRPFRVHTSNSIAEDLGTEFVVTAYPEARTTQVVVASGLVALRNGGAAGRVAGRPILLTLERGDLGRLDAAGAATLTRNVDVAAYLGWTTGTLAFNAVPLREALARLEHWYDVEIRLADTSLAGRRFTASFREAPVTDVLRVLEIALDVRADRNGRVVTLWPVTAAAPKR